MLERHRIVAALGAPAIAAECGLAKRWPSLALRFGNPSVADITPTAEQFHVLEHIAVVKACPKYNRIDRSRVCARPAAVVPPFVMGFSLAPLMGSSDSITPIEVWPSGQMHLNTS